MTNKRLKLVQLADAILMADMGTSARAYSLLCDLFEDDPEIRDILKQVDATDGCFYFPEDHIGIESSLTQGN